MESPVNLKFVTKFEFAAVIGEACTLYFYDLQIMLDNLGTLHISIGVKS